jgi:hypothetical protein
MAPEPEEVAWVLNYFNYFTEVEEHFQKTRATGLFLMSPLDWALVETWKNAGVPLAAVLRGIDVAFEKWRSRKNRVQMVNSLAYCAQAVLTEAQVMAGVVQAAPVRKEATAPFSLEELQGYLLASVAELRKHGDYEEIAEGVARLVADAGALYGDLEEMERHLTTIEEKMIAIARTRQSNEELFEARKELDLQLRPYRGKMTAEQLAMLEKQYLERQVLASAGLPRLSLFYLR